MSNPDLKRQPLMPPVVLAILFFIMAMIFRVIDIFVLRLHLTPFSIISSKVIPLAILLIYVGIAYRTVSVLGIHRRYLSINIILGVLSYLVYFVLPFYLEYFIEITFGLGPFFIVAVYPSSYIAYFIVFYIINSFMEEGVFRGLMMRCFMTKTNVYGANIIQAIFFGFWHIVWALDAFIVGYMDPITAGWYAVYYVGSTFGFGIVTGYMFQKTGSLFGPIILHTFWNFTIFMTTYSYLFPPAGHINILLYGTTLATEVVGLVIAIIITKFISERRMLPELTSWNTRLPHEKS